MGEGIATYPPETAPTDVFITEALARRSPKRTDYQREIRALLDLAVDMTDAPAEVLPHLVSLAMEMTGAVSAGLSLYDPMGASDIFRWRHLRGTLAAFENATTPRNDSPCGVTLDLNTPVLVAHPERIYDWIAAENLVLPEILLVPLASGREEPLGTLWMVAESSGHFDSGDARAASELAEFVGIALRMLRRGDRSLHALEEQETVAQEMGHRLKNLFAITDGMIRGSAKHTETSAELADALSGRIHALAHAHALVGRRVSDLDLPIRTADLGEVIRAVVSALGTTNGQDATPLTIEGPQIDIGDHAGNGIALIFHELATNAAKYGALKKEGGRIDIGWRREGGKLVVQWTECGGPPVEPEPVRSGYGNTLMQRIVQGQFRGVLERDWRREGLAITMTLSLDRMTG